MALALVEGLSFTYTGAGRPSLRDVHLAVKPGEVVLLAGPSGSGKTTLIRALSGLVPHFHGGRFAGRVTVGGFDTRRTRPADLAGTVGTVFQDPEDQVIFGGVEAEVAFGPENAGVPPGEIAGRTRAALASVGAEHLLGRPVASLSGGELQRVCLAATLAVEPRLLLLDEPTSQLDARGADSLLRLVRRLARARGVAVVLSEQRIAQALGIADRVVALDEGSVVSSELRPERGPMPSARGVIGEIVCRLEGVSFAYGAGPKVLEGVSASVRRGEIVALVGPNGSGKTTLAKIAAGLLEADVGVTARHGRAAMLTQDPGRFLVRERCDEEVRLGASSRKSADRALEAVGLGGYEDRHPRDLSSGERERLALAAVFANEPDLLVLDEPTRGVDPAARRRLAALLRAEAPSRGTLIVTHDADLVAAVADRVIDLTEGAERVAA